MVPWLAVSFPLSCRRRQMHAPPSIAFPAPRALARALAAIIPWLAVSFPLSCCCLPPRQPEAAVCPALYNFPSSARACVPPRGRSQPRLFNACFLGSPAVAPDHQRSIPRWPARAAGGAATAAAASSAMLPHGRRLAPVGRDLAQVLLRLWAPQPALPHAPTGRCLSLTLIHIRTIRLWVG